MPRIARIIAPGIPHRRYSAMINRRQKWTGHLWQGRFSSFPMDETCLFAAAKYIEMNPVRARLVADPYSWLWSSASAHAAGKDDLLVTVAPLLEVAGDWRLFLSDADEEDATGIRCHVRTGRVLGNDSFLETPEETLQHNVKPRKAGCKRILDQ